MATTTASLLRSLLTRSDLDRLDLGDAQVDQWLQLGALSALGALKNDCDADEHVFEVPDTSLQAELAERLRPLGKPDVVLSPERIRSFLRAAAADGGADAAVAAALLDRSEPAAASVDPPAADAPSVAAASDEQALAAEAETTAPSAETAVPAAAIEDSTDAEIEALMSPSPLRTNRLPDTDWFDISELEAAMGELLPMTETGAPPSQTFTVPPAAPPAVNLPEDLYALTEMAHGHEQRLGDLAATVTALAERVQELERALVEAEVLVMPDAADAAPPDDDDADTREPDVAAPAPTADRRHVAVLTIASALSAWSVLMWFGTGSATLALSSLIAAVVLVALALGAARDASRPPRR